LLGVLSITMSIIQNIVFTIIGENITKKIRS
jgi:hypothetical protein